MSTSHAYPQWKAEFMSPIEGLVRNALHTRLQPWTVVIGGVPCQLRTPLYSVARDKEQGAQDSSCGIKPLDTIALYLVLHLGADRWLVEVGQGLPLALHPALADVVDESVLPQALRHAVVELLATPLVDAFGDFMDMRITCEVLGADGNSDSPADANSNLSALQGIKQQAICALPFTLSVPATPSTQASLVPCAVHIVGQESASLFYQKVSNLAPNIHDVSGLAVPVSVEAGAIVLTAEECAFLCVDDVLLPDSYPAKDGRLTLRMSQCMMLCVLAQGKATVEAIVPLENKAATVPFLGAKASGIQGENSMSSEQNSVPAHQAAAETIDSVHVASLDVTVTFELERRTMTLGELSLVAPGYTFALGVDALAPVTLRVGEKVFGTGRLVDLGGTMGVQVTSLADNAKVTKPVQTTAIGPIASTVSLESDADPKPVRGLASFKQSQADDAAMPQDLMTGDFA